MASKSEDEQPPPPMTEGHRIAKLMARAGLASRREAETWIAAGRVAVNGAVITSPAIKVGTTDRVTVDGKPLPLRERTRLFLFHKPRGLVTTTSDPEGRQTVFDALPKHLPRLVSVGRLDFNTEGLLLLTNDGGLARVLEHPQTGWLRRYRVRAHGSVTQAQLDSLREGVTIDGIHYGPIEAALDRSRGANTWLTFAIREGKNREVRNVLGALDLGVNRLIRISFGPFQLGELAEGAVEELRTRMLREQLGKRIAALADADFDGPMLTRDNSSRAHQFGMHAEKRPRAGRGSGSEGAHRGRASFENSPRRLHADDEARRKRHTGQDDAREQRRPPQDNEGSGKPRPWRGRNRERPVDADTRTSDSSHKTKTGLLTDRKGRPVLVQRLESARPQQEQAGTRARARSSKREKPARDRRRGPRPARPAPQQDKH